MRSGNMPGPGVVSSIVRFIPREPEKTGNMRTVRRYRDE